MHPQLAITVVKRNEDTASVKATVVPSLGRLGREDADNKASGNNATTIQVINPNTVAYAHSFAVRIFYVLHLSLTLALHLGQAQEKVEIRQVAYFQESLSASKNTCNCWGFGAL